jgi:hypothetical protein
VPHSSKATYGGMAYSVAELTVVRTNLAPAARRGESCACPGAASRVAVWEPLVWSSSVRQLKGWADEGWRLHSSGYGDVLSSWAPTAPGVVLQCSGW